MNNNHNDACNNVVKPDFTRHREIAVWLELVSEAIVTARMNPSKMGGHPSEALATLLYRYDAILRASVPDLSAELWWNILDAFCGTSGYMAWTRDIPGASRLTLISAVADALEESMSGDMRRLLAPLQELTEAEAAAVLDLNDRYWLGDEEVMEWLNQKFSD